MEQLPNHANGGKVTISLNPTHPNLTIHLKIKDQTFSDTIEW